MVDCMRRKQNIRLCTYADVLCPRPGSYGDVSPPRERVYRLDSRDEHSPEPEDRFGLGINLRGSDIWLEPLHDQRSNRERSSKRHRDTCGPTRRRASPRAAACWDVAVTRGSRGLGLSIESARGDWAGHVCVKRVFPHQPAASTGQIRAGDVLLRVNELPMRGLSVQEVLHALRLAGTEVLLSLVRPTGQASDDLSDSEGELPPAAEVARSASRDTLSPDLDSAGTFEVQMEKVNNTLGLSLRRTDDTVLGHVIRAKVRQPALSDTRVRVGDKLIQVNGVDTTCMSHAEVVAFLRQCSDRVALTLYRDGQTTPGSPGSPVNSRSTRLRPEAVEMLSGLAFRRELSQPTDSEDGSPLELAARGSRAERVRRLSCGSRGSRGSPRMRSKRCTPSPDHCAVAEDSFSRLSGVDELDSVTSERLDQLTRISESSSMEGVTSERLDQLARISESSSVEGVTSERLDQLARISESSSMEGVTSERLDQLVLISQNSGGVDSDGWIDSGDDSDAELHERHLRRVAGEAVAAGGDGGSARGRQAYRSIQPQQRTKSGHVLKRISSEERLDPVADVGGDLLKWKGFTLEGDQDADSGIVSGSEGTSRGQSMCIQLRRGWSSRLGFSLHSTDGSHVVSQIYPDSVAARDGRLQVGDVLVKVNDVPVKGLTSEEVIDLLRRTKGAIGLTVVRL